MLTGRMRILAHPSFFYQPEILQQELMNEVGQVYWVSVPILVDAVEYEKAYPRLNQPKEKPDDSATAG